MTAQSPLFPFGRPVEKRTTVPTGPRRVFLLGAYPSALHVEWKPPKLPAVKALAVDNEPEPFWTGHDEKPRIEAWAKAVEWRDEWGRVAPVGPLNGSSGQWVDEKVLAVLGATREQTFITDCLDTYRFSKGQQDVVTGRFAEFAQKLGLPWGGVPELLLHPTEDQIFNEARLNHLPRLTEEIRVTQPELVVTLGNAALRVFARLAGVKELDALAHDSKYGTPIRVEVAGRHATWIPLMHPGQRSQDWQSAHGRWIHLRNK